SIVRAGDTLFEIGAIAAEPASVEPVAGPTMVGRSAPFLAAVRDLDRAARSPLSVLLQGETGTGKEVLAARLHALSARSGPLVTVNCAAIPRELLESTMFGHKKGAFTSALQDTLGLFAQADGGTLFLDEIADLPLELQPKLLRAVETGEVTPVGQSAPVTVDVRVVSATNADLAARVEAGAFRRD